MQIAWIWATDVITGPEVNFLQVSLVLDPLNGAGMAQLISPGYVKHC